jgi:drug/metabolite transporter (DMT)-like permease
LKGYGILLVILGAVLWGTDSLFRRPLTQDYSPVTIVFLEHCVIVLVMLPGMIRLRRELLRLAPGDWLCLAFIAVGGSVGATSLFTYSIKYGNPSVTVLLQKTQPIFATLLARGFLSEAPKRSSYLWFPAALAGAYLVSTPDWTSGLDIRIVASSTIAAALGAAALWGSSTVCGRYVAGRLPISVITGLRFCIALPVLSILYFLQPASLRVLPSAPVPFARLIAMALIPGLAALILYYKGLKSTIAPVASIAELAFPVTTVVTNWVFLGAHLSHSQIVGGILLVASITGFTCGNTGDRSLVVSPAPDSTAA